ncbi:dienelactone hydrolase family protein [Novosphingobium rosa]|uniref:dienelactone hydrolase family protein n=1 Tax=Novosphingobium rosa TaxID=76978 RepID=UPI00082F202C|nr:dienelactone hydrolase family protein [Novosphingobium rosa]
MTTNTLIPSLDHTGEIPAYVAKPEGAPRGTVIVVPEIFGVNPGIVSKADDWANKGYVAIAPDVFWRQEAGVELDHDVPEEMTRALSMMSAHDFPAGVDDIRALIAWARAQNPEVKVGLVGFCMGGLVAYQAAARTEIDAAVGYYGVGLDQLLGEAKNIRGQLLLHIPTADAFTSPEQQKAIHAGLDSVPNVTLYDYEGLGHGFAETKGSRRDEAGAVLADARTVEFIAKFVG